MRLLLMAVAAPAPICSSDAVKEDQIDSAGNQYREAWINQQQGTKMEFDPGRGK
jgi:hypothetical protein